MIFLLLWWRSDDWKNLWLWKLFIFSFCYDQSSFDWKEIFGLKKVVLCSVYRKDTEHKITCVIPKGLDRGIPTHISSHIFKSFVIGDEHLPAIDDEPRLHDSYSKSFDGKTQWHIFWLTLECLSSSPVRQFFKEYNYYLGYEQLQES